MDLSKLEHLTFYKPDYEKFPCLKLAFDALSTGSTAPAVLNAANEIAVNLFLEKKLSFTGIPKIIEKVMNKHDNHHLLKLDDIIEADRWARMMALEIGAQFLRKD